MAIIEISEQFLEEGDMVIEALKKHFGGMKELRYLRKPHPKTRTFYVESDNFKPSQQICPTFHRDENGKVTLLKED